MNEDVQLQMSPEAAQATAQFFVDLATGFSGLSESLVELIRQLAIHRQIHQNILDALSVQPESDGLMDLVSAAEMLRTLRKSPTRGVQ